MPSSFAADFAACSPDFDDEFGEPVVLIPQTKGKAGGNAYFKRPADETATGTPLVAIFTDETAIDRVLGSGANTHENVDVLTAKSSFEFDHSLFASHGGPNPDPLEGWLIQAITQPRSPRYVITTVEPDGVSRLLCRCTFQDFAS